MAKSVYIEFEHLINEEKVLKEIQDRMFNYGKNLGYIMVLIKSLEKWEGKQITKRIETALNKEYKELRVILSKDYGMFHIYIYPAKDNFNYDDKSSFLIGYSSDPYINMERIKEYNTGYLSNQEDINKLTEAKKHYKRLVKVWNKTINKLKEINTEGKKYGLEYIIELNREL